MYSKFKECTKYKVLSVQECLQVLVPCTVVPGTSGKPGGRGRGGHNYGAMQSNDRNIRTRKELEKQCITFGWKIEQTR